MALMSWNLEQNIDIINQFLHTAPNRILEIGCFEGDSTIVWLDNVLVNDGTIVCIDPFNVSDEDAFGHSDLMTDLSIENKFWSNVHKHRKPNQNVVLRKGRSYHELADLITLNQTFDLIYIDGNHTAPSVMTDACMSFGLLSKGGIMLFDDFFLRDNLGVNGCTQDFLDWPKIAIDCFTSLFHKNIEILFINEQYAIRKW